MMSKGKEFKINRWLLFLFSAIPFLLAFLYFGGSQASMETGDEYRDAIKICYLILVGVGLLIQLITICLYMKDFKKASDRLTLIRMCCVIGFIAIEGALVLVEVFAW